MIGLQGDFILQVLAAWGLGMTSNSLAACIGAAVPDVKDVTELAPLLFVPQMLFAGVFVRTSQLPIFLRWAQYLCGLKYAIALIYLNEFNLELDSCRGDARENCRNVLLENDVNGDRFWINIVLLFVLFFCFRMIAGVILVKKAQSFY